MQSEPPESLELLPSPAPSGRIYGGRWSRAELLRLLVLAREIGSFRSADSDRAEGRALAVLLRAEDFPRRSGRAVAATLRILVICRPSHPSNSELARRRGLERVLGLAPDSLPLTVTSRAFAELVFRLSSEEREVVLRGTSLASLGFPPHPNLNRVVSELVRLPGFFCAEICFARGDVRVRPDGSIEEIERSSPGGSASRPGEG